MRDLTIVTIVYGIVLLTIQGILSFVFRLQKKRYPIIFLSTGILMATGLVLLQIN